MGLVRNQCSKFEEIIDYLNKHPDFFILHPEILTDLNIPHQLNDNVSSLIEYQVKKLRQDISTLKNSMSVLEHEKNKNRELARQVNSLALSLINEKVINQSYDLLSRGLKKYYAANKVLLYIFSKYTTNKNYSGLRFLDLNSKLRFMFTEVFHRGKPLCGSLQEEHIKLLFGKPYNMINSTILIPLHQPDWQGLFVVGSQEHNCYSHGFELDSLVYLSNILSLTINKQIT